MLKSVKFQLQRKLLFTAVVRLAKVTKFNSKRKALNVIFY